MFEIDKKQTYLQKHKITEAEFNSFPKWAQNAVVRGGKTSAFTKQFLKDTPRVKTAKDTTYLPVTGRYGQPRLDKRGIPIMAGFETETEARKIREYQIKELQKEPKKPKEPEPKTPEEAYRRKITKFTGEIGELSKTAKRLEEIGVEAEPITQQIKALSDSIRIAGEDFKKRGKVQENKALIAGTKKLTKLQKNRIEVARANINRALTSGTDISVVRELIKKNWGISLEEFNQIYKHNR